MAVTPLIPVMLFDMDGVLVDVSGSYRRAIEETVYHFTGREVQQEMIQRYKDRGGFNDDWELTHTIIGDFGMETPFARVVTEFQRRYRGEDWDGFITEEHPFIQTETLVELKKLGHILGIVTGRPEVEAYWTLDRWGWREFFPLMIGRERQGNRKKPDPFPLLLALGRLNAAGIQVAAERTVYIGDSVDDVTAARAAGMLSIGVVHPNTDPQTHEPLLLERGANLVITDPNSLPGLVSWPNDWAGEIFEA